MPQNRYDLLSFGCEVFFCLFTYSRFRGGSKDFLVVFVEVDGPVLFELGVQDSVVEAVDDELF